MEPARFSLRIHPVIMKKMKVIAENNGRSVNKEIEQILNGLLTITKTKKAKLKLTIKTSSYKNTQKPIKASAYFLIHF